MTKEKVIFESDEFRSTYRFEGNLLIVKLLDKKRDAYYETEYERHTSKERG